MEHIAGKLKIYNAVRDDMSKSQPHSPSEEKKEPEMPEVVKAQLKMIEDMTEKVQEAQRTMLRLTGAEPEEVTVVVKETREEKMRREMRVAAVLASLLVPLLIFPFIRNFGGRVVVACFVGAFCWGKMGWEEVVMEEGAHGGKDGKSDEDRHERMKRRHSRSEKHVAEDKTWEAYTPVIGAGAWGLTMLLMAGIVR